MKRDVMLEAVESFESLTSDTRERLEFIERGLLQNTFLVRDKNSSTKRDFMLLYQNMDTVSAFFDLFGYRLTIDRNTGVARLSCEKDAQTTRVSLSGPLAYLLCVIWTMYRDRMAAGSMSKSLYTTTSDILNEIDKYGLRSKFGGSNFRIYMKELKRFNLIDYAGDPTPMDTPITMFPSLQFCMDETAFREYVENIVKEKLSGNKEEDDDENDEYAEEEGDSSDE